MCCDRRVRRTRRWKGVADEVGEQLREFLDLPKLVGHAFAGLAAVVGDAEGAKPRGVGGDRVLLGAIVRGRNCRAAACRHAVVPTSGVFRRHGGKRRPYNFQAR